MNRFFLIVCVLLVCGVAAGRLAAADEAPADAPASPWPLDIPHTSGTITLYQPQPERLVGNALTGRAAASFLANGKSEDERVFGALWFTATLDIDRDHNGAKVRSMTITKIVTPSGEKTTDDGAEAKRAIQEAVVAKGIEIDLDRLTATLEETPAADDPTYNPAPPRILIRQVPTVLVVLDGEPQIRETDGVKRVINSPAFLVQDSAGAWWLRGDEDWLTATALDGPWTLPSGAPLPAVLAAAKTAGFTTAMMRAAATPAPMVIIAKEPSELVVFDGKPAFAPIGDGAVLSATNTDTTVLVEVASGKQFVLLAGRWYRAARLTDEATWEWVKPDRLPAAFAQLPTTPEWEAVRAQIAGTPEADEALVQQQIPQTARIPRTASITATYDGAPQWAKVSGLEVEYAENSADAVFRIPGPRFYACRDGVWYEGADPLAALTVATSVPDALRHLPPDCPWHNCSYVTVYESSPEYVWCGYTPGYLGWYAWHGCPIYGTGWPYHGWYGPVVYPRPLTWGVGIHYNPATGWGVSVGVGGPHWSIGVSTGGGYHGGGWWGSGGVNNINIDNSTNINVGNGNRPTTRPALYDRVPGAERPKLQDAGDRMRNGAAATRPAGKPARENLAVDRDGTIARPTTDGGWQARDNGAWKDLPKPAAKPGTKPDARPADRRPALPERPATPVTRPAPSLERTQQMRNRGEQRAQQRTQPASRPTGGGNRHR